MEQLDYYGEEFEKDLAELNRGEFFVYRPKPQGISVGSEKLKALSLLQPWANCVLFLGKDVENRSWSTNYRGGFLIHASAGWDKMGEIFVKKNWLKIWSRMDIAVKNTVARPFESPSWDRFLSDAAQRRRGLVGYAEIHSIFPVAPPEIRGLWEFGPNVWRLKNVVRAKGVFPMKGALGFFKTGITRDQFFGQGGEA